MNNEHNGWHLIHELHIQCCRACVCVHTATVVRDSRRSAPYAIEGCVVGVVVRITDEHFVLAGWSFATRVAWEDVVEAWPRGNAPSPCPHCGKKDLFVAEHPSRDPSSKDQQ